MEKLKNILFIIGIVLFVFILYLGIFKSPSINDSSENVNSKALEFKEDYENINGLDNGFGTNFRTLTIDEDNPFIKVSPEEIVNKINNKESFYLYVGDKRCPWCRSVIEIACQKAKEYNINEIYYLNIWEDNNEYKEVLRDKYKLNDKNKPEKVSDGTKEYEELLKAFDNVLSDYKLTTSKGKKVSIGEKRIYAPNYIYIKDGKAVKLTEGISDKQKDSNKELSDEIISDEKKLFDDFFKDNN